MPEDYYVISPSQINTWHECKRKWAWRAIAKVKAPDKASAVLGTKMHKALEGYLGGKPWDFSTPEAKFISEIAISGLQFLPKPNTPGMSLEGHFLFNNEITGPIKYQGYRDFTLEDSAAVPGMLGGVPLVGDHKSTSDFKWMKKADDLRTDPQGVIYAYEALQKFKVDAVDLTWVYYLTRGKSRQAKRTHLRVYAQDVEVEFRKLQVTSLEIATTSRTVTDVLSILPPPVNERGVREACEGYGGCPYRANCKDLSAFSGAKPMTQPMVDFFQRLKGANGLLAAAASTPPATPSAPPVAAPTPPAMPAPPAVAASAAPPVPVMPVAPPVAPLPAGITNAPADWVAPSFLSASSAPPALAYKPPAPVLPASMAPAAQTASIVVAINPPGEASPPAVVPPPIPAAAAPAPAAEKPKRVRRTNAQIAAANLADMQTNGTAHAPPGDAAIAEAIGVVTREETPAAFPPEASPALPAPSAVAVVEKTIGILYLDCAPDDVTGLKEASALFSAAKVAIKTELGEADYRFIKYTGAAVFSTGVLKLLEASPAEGLVLDTRTPEGLIVLEDLIARAHFVVRGLR